MQKDSKLFDDLAKLAGSAAGTFADMKRESEALVMDKMEKLLSRMHLVRREEFEVVRLMAEEARAEQEKSAKRLAELEKLLESKGSPDKTTPKKSQK